MTMRTLPIADASPNAARVTSRSASLARRSSLSTRAWDALARSILCFAAMHVAILLVYVVTRRDASALNLFTMLEAQRLWPALASDATARWWSLGFGLMVYGGVCAVFVGRMAPANRDLRAFARRTPVRHVPFRVAQPPHRNGDSATRGHVMRPELWPTRTPVTAGFGTLALVLGLAVHMLALASTDVLVRHFPSVPDLLHERLPYVDFGAPGEYAYAAFMLAMVFVLFRSQRRTVPVILALLGLFYAVRGLFLFLLPIGSPPTAPPLDARFVLWPFPGHAYFPGGHTGMMTVLSLSVVSMPWRRAFLAATIAFAIGTLLARTHYSADALGGWLVGYAIVLWGRRRFGPVPSGHVVARPASVHPEIAKAEV